MVIMNGNARVFEKPFKEDTGSSDELRKISIYGVTSYNDIVGVPIEITSSFSQPSYINININSLGNKPIKFQSSSTLPADVIKLGLPYRVVYVGDSFALLGVSTSSGGDSNDYILTKNILTITSETSGVDINVALGGQSFIEEFQQALDSKKNIVIQAQHESEVITVLKTSTSIDTSISKQVDTVVLIMSETKKLRTIKLIRDIDAVLYESAEVTDEDLGGATESDTIIFGDLFSIFETSSSDDIKEVLNNMSSNDLSLAVQEGKCFISRGNTITTPITVFRNTVTPTTFTFMGIRSLSIVEVKITISETTYSFISRTVYYLDSLNSSSFGFYYWPIGTGAEVTDVISPKTFENIKLGTTFSYPSADRSSRIYASVVGLGEFMSGEYVVKRLSYLSNGYASDFCLSYKDNKVYFGQLGLSASEGGGLACFEGDILVDTPKGFVPIKSLEIGDEVYSVNRHSGNIELNEIKNIVSHTTNNTYKITTEDSELIVTGDHELQILNNESRTLVEDLKPGDVLETKDSKTKIISIEKLDEYSVVYDIQVENNYNYFVGINSVLAYTEEYTKNLK